MGDCKRIAVTEALSTGGNNMSKRRRIIDSSETLIVSPSPCDLADDDQYGDRSSLLIANASDHDEHAMSPVNYSLENSGCFGSGRDQFCFPALCFSGKKSDDVEQDHSLRSIDVESKCSEPVDFITSIDREFREESTPTSKLTEDKNSPATNIGEKCCWRILPAAKMVSRTEIEDFFAEAEKNVQKQFEWKYNFDVVKDMPLEGRYLWVRLKP